MKIIKTFSFFIMIIFGSLSIATANLNYLSFMLLFFGFATLINTNPKNNKKIDLFGLVPLIGGILAIIYIWIL